MLKETILSRFENFLKPPRHELMNLEENGIKTYFPYGRTIITASFASHKDPHNENPRIDFSARENAVWLTHKKIVEGQGYDFVIGADGESSSMAVQWSNGVAEILMEIEGRMQKIEGVERNEKVSFIAPENSDTSFIYKKYPKQSLKEFYGIMRLPQSLEAGDFTFPATFKPYITKETLVSGMRNRKRSGSTSFWAVRMTDGSNLPFGRELPKSK